MDTSDPTNMSVAEKLKLVEKLWDEIAASTEPIVLPPEALSEIARRANEVDADPSILIDEDELWRRVDGYAPPLSSQLCRRPVVSNKLLRLHLN